VTKPARRRRLLTRSNSAVSNLRFARLERSRPACPTMHRSAGASFARYGAVSANETHICSCSVSLQISKADFSVRSLARDTTSSMRTDLLSLRLTFLMKPLYLTRCEVNDFLRGECRSNLTPRERLFCWRTRRVEWLLKKGCRPRRNPSFAFNAESVVWP